MSEAWEPEWAVNPGETLREVLEERGWSQLDLAAAMEYTPKHINRVVRGHDPITIPFAFDLEQALGIRAEVWINLEVAYRRAGGRTTSPPSG